MTIEVEPERARRRARQGRPQAGAEGQVPGFRPGKAPAAMVRRYFGEERVLDEALDDPGARRLQEAVEADESIDPIARPRLVVETTEPLVVKATIPVQPDRRPRRLRKPSASRSRRSPSRVARR